MCGYEGRLHLLPLASLLPQPLTYSNKFFPSSYTNPKQKPLNTLTHLSVVYPNLSQQFLSLEQPDPATFHILPRLGHIRFTALSSLTHRQALLTTHCQDLTGSHAHLVVLRLDCRLTQLPTTYASQSKLRSASFDLPAWPWHAAATQGLHSPSPMGSFSGSPVDLHSTYSTQSYQRALTPTTNIPQRDKTLEKW